MNIYSINIITDVVRDDSGSVISAGRVHNTYPIICSTDNKYDITTITKQQFYKTIYEKYIKRIPESIRQNTFLYIRLFNDITKAINEYKVPTI